MINEINMVAITLTNLEIQGLQSITNSDFYENGRQSIVWDYSVYDYCPFKGKKRSGVFSSLSQKGIVNIQEGEKKYLKDENGNKILNKSWSRDGLNFGTLQITEYGYEVLESLGLLDEYDRVIVKS